MIINKKKAYLDILRRYRKTILYSIAHAFSIGFAYSLWTATYTLTNISNGDYPGMPKELIQEKYNEAAPIVITHSVIKCIVIMLVLLFPLLIYRFKIKHNINLFYELKKYIKSRKC